MRRVTGRAGRAATMAGGFTAPVIVAAVGTAFLPLVAAALIAVAVLVAAFIVVGIVVDPKGRATGFAAACVIGASLAVLAGTPLLLLRIRGERTYATVTAENVGYTKAGTKHEYTLVAADGRKIPGTLSEPDDEFSVGDRVDVVFDPYGLAAPHDADFVQLALPLGAAAVVLLVASALLCVPATRPKRLPT